MWILYHQWLCPFSRKLRVYFQEKGVNFTLQLEKPWERRKEFLALNPRGSLPIVQNEENIVIIGSQVIAEYMEETLEGRSFIGSTALERAEIRRLVDWFEETFYFDVTKPLLNEKIYKRLLKTGEPNSKILRAARHNIHTHLDYIGWLALKRDWLGGEALTLADITAASQLSCLDYLGDVPWSEHKDAKHWYARIKSRPSFRALLNDIMPGFKPSADYGNLDF